MNPEQVKSETIKFGATVTILEGEVSKTYHIVGQDEIDLSKSKISWKSPIGKSLLGKEEGDLVEIKTPSGDRELEIVSIEYIAIP